MQIQNAIATLVERESLSEADMYAVMQQIMRGEATSAQIAGLSIALRMKGETVDELTAAARVMRDYSRRVPCERENLIDTCGTGGDGASLFNVSTTAAFVVAAAGGAVAKHGNKSISSTSGSSDVLEAAGVRLDIDSAHIVRCIEHVGVGFMYAPAHHSAMKHAIGPRREMGVRTFFNLLGPLANPAGVKRQVLGVYDRRWLRIMASVLGKLGSQHVMVVHSSDGLDELSIAAPTFVCEFKHGELHEYEVLPEAVGLTRQSLADCQVSSVDESLSVMRSVLKNEATAARDMVLLNAGAALLVAGLVRDMRAGVDMASDALASGLALEKLKELVAFTQLPYEEGEEI
ncbi:MAG: anthranilate phosphoribosyltransferase [Gammaproteobacteria bacterium]